MRRTITKYFRNGKAVIVGLIALNVLAVFWVAGVYVDMQNEAQVRAAQHEEEKSHVAEFITDEKKMLSTLSKCNNVGISYSSMSSELATHDDDLQYHMLEKLIDNMKSGEGVRLTLSTDYWKSSGLKCEYSYTHKAELYKLLPEEK
jgi:hypothetical protein